MGNKRRPKTNVEMCEIVQLRRKTRAQDDRIDELERALKNAIQQLKDAAYTYSTGCYDHSVKEYKNLLEQK